MNKRGQNMAGGREEPRAKPPRPMVRGAAGMALHRRACIKFLSSLGPGEHGVPAAAARAGISGARALDLYRGLVSPEPDEAFEANGQRAASHRAHRALCTKRAVVPGRRGECPGSKRTSQNHAATGTEPTGMVSTCHDSVLALVL